MSMMDNIMKADTPIPLWLDIGLFLAWCGVVGFSIIFVFLMANLFLGVAAMAGGGALLFGARMLLKRILQNMA